MLESKPSNNYGATQSIIIEKKEILSRRPSLELHKIRKEKEKEENNFINTLIRNLNTFCVNPTSIICSLYVVMLIIFTILERFTFKILANRMGDNYDILILEIYIFFIALYGCIVLVKSVLFDEITTQMSSFDTTELWKIAGMESIIFCIQLVSASHITITMTIILLQINSPVIALTTYLMNPNDIKFSKLQLIGISTITISLVLCIIKSMYHLFSNNDINNDDHVEDISTIVYFIASALQGLIVLYKENTLTQFALHIDHHYLNCWLYYYQFLLSLVIFPIIYLIQSNLFHININTNIDNNTNVSDTSYNTFIKLLWHWEEAFSCSVSGTSSNEGNCNNILPTVTLFVISNAAILLSIDKLISMNSRILNRAHMVSIIIAILLVICSPSIYNSLNNDSSTYEDSNPILVNVIVIFCLLIGMELYGNTGIDDTRDGIVLNNNDHNTSGMIMKV